MTPTTYNPNDIRPGALFITPDNIKCRVDRREGDRVHFTVLDGKDIEGKNELTMTLDELQNSHWKLHKAAA